MYWDKIQHKEKYGKLMQSNKKSQIYSNEEQIKWNENGRRRERYSGEEWEGRKDWKHSEYHHRLDRHYFNGERNQRQECYHHDDRQCWGRRYSEEEEQKGGKRWNESCVNCGKNRRSSTYSDDEGYKSRCHRRSIKKDDNDGHYDSKERKKNKDNMKCKKGKKRKCGTTNIDECDSSNTQDSGSGSDSCSNSDSSQSQHDNRKYPDRVIAGADHSDVENIDELITFQQSKIKQELVSLSQLQKESGSKTLIPQQQKVLQEDLLKLEQLQTIFTENKGNMSLQTQLLGQQMLFFSHLTEAKEAIKCHDEVIPVPMPQKSTTPTGTLSSPSDTLQLQMLQQQALTTEHQMQVMAVEHQLQAVVAEQQLQSMVGHQMQAEQQRRMMIAEEQQRQLQMAQMVSRSSPSYVSPQQTAFGMNIVSPPLYSPCGNCMGYF